MERHPTETRDHVRRVDGERDDSRMMRWTISLGIRWEAGEAGGFIGRRCRTKKKLPEKGGRWEGKEGELNEIES